MYVHDTTKRMMANDGKTALTHNRNAVSDFLLSRNPRTVACVKLRSNGSACVASYFKTRCQSARLVTKRVTLFPYKSSSARDVRSRRSFPIKSARSVNFISGDEIHQERALRLRLLNEI